MDIDIAKNLKYFRRQKKLTQEELAANLRIKRPALGAYEEGRARPAYEVLLQLAGMSDYSVEEWMRKDLEKLTRKKKAGKQEKEAGTGLRVLSITTNDKGRENIELVGQKAAASYLQGYSDPEFVQDLPRFSLPQLPKGTFRAFEIKGDSMLPIQPGSMVIAEYVEDWRQIKDGLTYIVVSKSEGVVYKRLFNHIRSEGKLWLRSDNPAYPPFELETDDVIEVWQAKAYISTVFPEPEMNKEDLMDMIVKMQKEMMQLKK